VPVPVWDDSFQPTVFARGIALGLVLTFTATIWPVRRAVQVSPIEAISTGPRRAGSPPGRLEQAMRLPGGSISQFPVRDVVRAPRRTALTVFGIAAVIAVLIAVVGMVDSFLATIDRGSEEILGDAPERVEVNLDSFYLADDDRVRSIADASGVASAEAGLRLGGSLYPAGAGGPPAPPDGSVDPPGVPDGERIDALISVIDLESPVWRPTLISGSVDEARPGVVISEKAAEDLGVGTGDPVTLRHPRREGLGYAFVESQLPVAAIHGNPYRFIVYMDISHADLFALDGIVNTLSVVPVPGVTNDDLKQELFARPAVAAVESVQDVADNVRDAIEEFLGFLYVVQAAILILAVLIAFNSTSISADERRREHATMFAFGLPVRTVLGLTMIESLIIGVIGTALGVLAGRVLLQWLITVLIPDTVPDLGVIVDVTPDTYLVAVLLGVLAVALAPVLTVRRLRRMDIPATLRVVE
jgi:putative ABC transport system permease protein